MGLLETSNLTKRFGTLTAVDSVSLDINEGEFRSIIGPNGAGKTTLLNMLSGRLNPSEGSVAFDGSDITGLPPYEIARKGFSRSFQINNIFPGLTVHENLRVVTQRADSYKRLFRSKSKLTDSIDKADEILQQFGLMDIRDTQAENISYGEKRILEVCIALANDPVCLLLDEPTAGLSSEETEQMMQLIQKLKEDHTILLVEHDMDIVMALSDKITVLNNGEVLVTEDPEEVRADENVRSVYLEGGITNA